MKFARFTAEGFPAAFYSPDIHGPRMRPVYGPVPEPTAENPHPTAPVIGEEPNPDCLIPADALEISDAVWRDLVENNARRRLVDGEIIPFEPPPPPIPVPGAISDRQFAHGLARRLIISRPEALAFVQTGAIPAALQAIVDGIADEDERFEAELLISGATSFQRQHPLTDAIGAAYGWNAEAIDDFWRECAAL